MDAVCTAPVLRQPRFKDPFIIDCDASAYAIGTVLQQEGEKGKLHPVAFLSRTLDTTQRNWDIYDKELYAVVHALETWRPYIVGNVHVTTFPAFAILYAHYGLSSPHPVYIPISSATSPSLFTVTLLFVITCRRSLAPSLSRTLTHYAHLLTFLSPISCTILKPVVAGLSQAFLVFNPS